MKTTELMINDWVLYREEVLKVTSLYTKRGANEIGFGESENFWVDISNIEPIPLTPEILEKNGLVKIDDLDGVSRYYIKLLNAEIRCVISFSFYDLIVGGVKTLLKCWYEFRGGTNSIHKCNVLYVHELQHALRLCGIEKEIEP